MRIVLKRSQVGSISEKFDCPKNYQVDNCSIGSLAKVPCGRKVQAYLTRRLSYVYAVAHLRYAPYRHEAAWRDVATGAAAAWAIHLGDLRPFRPVLGGPDCDGSGAAVAIAPVGWSHPPSPGAKDDWTYRLDHASRTIQISIAQESSDSPAITRIEVPSVGLASLADATNPLRMASPPAHASFCPVAEQLSSQQSFTSTYGLAEGAPVRFSDAQRFQSCRSAGAATILATTADAKVESRPLVSRVPGAALRHIQPPLGPWRKFLAAR